MDKDPAAPNIKSLSKLHSQDLTPYPAPPWSRPFHYATVFRKISLGFWEITEQIQMQKLGEKLPLPVTHVRQLSARLGRPQDVFCRFHANADLMMGQKLIEEAEQGWVGRLASHVTWDREPKGLWEREQWSWRTRSQQRGGLRFSKPRAEAEERGLWKQM